MDRSIIAKGVAFLYLSTSLMNAAVPAMADTVEAVEEPIDTVSSSENSYSGETYNITFEEESITAPGLVVKSDDGVSCVTISENGIYKLSGSGKNVCLSLAKVNATIILDDLTVDNTNISEYFIKSSKGAAIDLQLSGETTITGGEGAVSCKNGEINISGETLNIDSSTDDALKAKGGTVKISSGVINITDCQGDGIQAENVEINDGEVYISTYYDNAATGYYTSGQYSSGSSTAYNYLWENGDNKYERVNTDTGSHKGIKAGTKGKTIKFEDGTDDIEIESSGSLKISGGTIVIDTSASGLKSNKVTSSGYTATSAGNYIIGSPDDAIACNADIEISGGSLTLTSADDGISAAGTVTITGDTDIDILSAYEGIEGQTIIVGEDGSSSGPEININSNDDGINTSGKTLTYTYDSYDDYEEYDGDLYYTKQSKSATTGNDLYFYSGNITINIDSENEQTVELPNGSISSLKSISYKAAGDGVDCNGAFNQYGGKLYSYGQSSGDNSPIDTNDGYMFGSDAAVLGTGVDMMNESKPESGDGVYVTYGASSAGDFPGGEDGSGGDMPSDDMPGGDGPGGDFSPMGSVSSDQYTAGQYWKVTDEDGNVIDSGKLKYAGQFILYGSPKLSSGKEYSISVVDELSDTDGGSDGENNTDDSSSDASTSDNKAESTVSKDSSVSSNITETTINIGNVSHTIKYTNTLTYSGGKLKLEDFVIDGQSVGSTLSDNIIFKKLRYKSNKKAGTAYVIPVFKAASGADSSVKSAVKAVNKAFKSNPLQFTIAPCTMDASKISGTVTYKESSGKWSVNLKIAMSSGKTIKLKKKDFDVLGSTYDSTAKTVQIQGTNNYTGTVTLTDVSIK